MHPARSNELLRQQPAKHRWLLPRQRHLTPQFSGPLPLQRVSHRTLEILLSWDSPQSPGINATVSLICSIWFGPLEATVAQWSSAEEADAACSGSEASSGELKAQPEEAAGNKNQPISPSQPMLLLQPGGRSDSTCHPGQYLLQHHLFKCMRLSRVATSSNGGSSC